MRLTRPVRSRSYGQLRIFDEIRVVELDSFGQRSLTVDGNGDTRDSNGYKDSETVTFSHQSLDKVLSNMVIVVPCMNENLDIIRNVIEAIPASCAVILVSNSPRNEYLLQVDMLKKSFSRTRRLMVSIHQKDAAAATAFAASGMKELLDPVDGTIRDGKGEGMLLAIAVAASFFPKHRYVGFVDADNFNPGSVSEYCRAYAAGFAMSADPEVEHSMVRLRWASKPKFRNGEFEFVSEGRCSRVVNRWLNKLFNPGAEQYFSEQSRRLSSAVSLTNDASHGDDLKPFVSTGNAGEHAMTMELALKLRFAAGYAIEPFHYVDLLERACFMLRQGIKESSNSVKRLSLNGITRSAVLPHAQPLKKPVKILQIRTLNPHFHRSSGQEHIRRMWAAGLGAIYHNLAPYSQISGVETANICQFRQDMHAFAVEHGGISEETGELPRPTVYPALEQANLELFREVMKQKSELMIWVRPV
ncbi:uncharacterized protein CTHT_0072260 [Thermochaetoides thermophila DSM 1495]|uniref:Uncharacterized protein n=1 Tax=Chaetomium thermophilum (strain DSM 1495 / CBS 144.50 / IMI 039719) TaxID=759272 RepID=G0SFV4_CHATD|nr:hypothetical protein CTHT_0072260 [Thermochaetoides thermophila DSM 1495]EGS17869.1 hypothetical protein CTHT_0072260 [Thermochaetoides thermophila DSM 1495]